ncbi:MAG: YlbF family regulator [Clostridia bacterium]|nr:YlbF family regulator [Clostridia bacterium]
MDAFEKAKELGEIIKNSKMMADFKRAEEAYEQDPFAKDLFDTYKNIQMDLLRATKGNKPQDEIMDLRGKLVSKQDEINGYAVTKDFLDRKAKLDDFIKKVNDVLMYAITGEESCSSHGCGSCGGCK